MDGFRNDFTLGYQGRMDIQIKSPNLRFQEGVGNEIELWNKVMKEVKEHRYAGPFKDIPFQDGGGFIQSPIGLVPKDNGTSTRLIFHLSYPRGANSTSINANTPKDICTVCYPDFISAVRLCLKEGRNCFCSKSDWKSAFRHFPIQKHFWRFLIMKARNPIDKKWYYFVDKCMPFGASISCAHFQTFSNAISYIMEHRTKKENVNYLDDFLFIALLAHFCNYQIEVFLDICNQINFPVTMDKTCWASTVITFLGMLLDTERQTISIPAGKIEKALQQIETILRSRKRKATVIQIQRLCGLLNFICRVIVPGRPFLMRMYSSLRGMLSKLKPYHHVKLEKDMILDLQIWKIFLESPTVFLSSIHRLQ